MTFIENLNWRYATKKFDGEKVSDENLEKIKYAIKMAPTSFGVQPFHVSIISDKKVLEKLKKHAPNNEAKFETCSHILVFSNRVDVAKRFLDLQIMQNRKGNFLKNMGLGIQYLAWALSRFVVGRFLTKNIWSRNQAYIPLGFALAACAELQIDSCPMEGFNSNRFAKVLNLPKIYKPAVLLAIGFRDENEVVFPKVKFNDLFTEIK